MMSSRFAVTAALLVGLVASSPTPTDYVEADAIVPEAESESTSLIDVNAELTGLTGYGKCSGLTTCHDLRKHPKLAESQVGYPDIPCVDSLQCCRVDWKSYRETSKTTNPCSNILDVKTLGRTFGSNDTPDLLNKCRAHQACIDKKDKNKAETCKVEMCTQKMCKWGRTTYTECKKKTHKFTGSIVHKYYGLRVNGYCKKVIAMDEDQGRGKHCKKEYSDNKSISPFRRGKGWTYYSLPYDLSGDLCGIHIEPRKNTCEQ